MSTVTDLASLVPVVVAGGIVTDFTERTFDSKPRKRKVNKSKKRKKKITRKSSNGMTVLGIKV